MIILSVWSLIWRSLEDLLLLGPFLQLLFRPVRIVLRKRVDLGLTSATLPVPCVVVWWAKPCRFIFYIYFAFPRICLLVKWAKQNVCPLTFGCSDSQSKYLDPAEDFFIRFSINDFRYSLDLPKSSCKKERDDLCRTAHSWIAGRFLGRQAVPLITILDQ